MDSEVYDLFRKAETKGTKRALCYWYLSDIKDWLQLYSDGLIKDDEIYDTFISAWTNCGEDLAGAAITASIDMKETEVGYDDETGTTMWDIIKDHRPRLPKKIRKSGITLYRACNKNELENNYYEDMGASWTTDIHIARRFLSANFDGIIVKCDADDKTIYGFSDDRGEKEFLCPYIGTSSCEIVETTSNKNPDMTVAEKTA